MENEGEVCATSKPDTRTKFVLARPRWNTETLCGRVTFLEVIIADMLMPIISIAFYMVLIGIAIKRKHHSHSSTIGTAIEMEQGDLQLHPMQFLQVQLTLDDATADPVGVIGSKERLSTFQAESRKGLEL
ncbi:hypothetical protein EDD22DRAFT_1049754 [Suillus occidentalis]|nr:hypothetical protein EDD22DRAFT_1049754 [Suillus occidentalis]